LCTIRGFVDRLFTTKAVLIGTGLLLVASWIYPPWIVGSYRNVSHGWFFIFDTTRETAMRVDFGRLLLIDAVIVAVGGLFAWAIFSDSTARRVIVRLAFYALLIRIARLSRPERTRRCGSADFPPSSPTNRGWQQSYRGSSSSRSCQFPY
jgi:hypothetical protein